MHTIDTKFGPVQVRVYRLREGWWPVIVGRHRAPTAPSLEDPLPQSVEQGITRMQEAVDGLTSQDDGSVRLDPRRAGHPHSATRPRGHLEPFAPDTGVSRGRRTGGPSSSSRAPAAPVR